MEISTSFVQNNDGVVVVTIVVNIDTNNQIIKVSNYANKAAADERFAKINPILEQKVAKLNFLQNEIDLLNAEQDILFSLF
jgi:hypothetical protein